jgi:hypothetical protein
MLFEAFQIAAAEVERALGRSLSGDPSRGERGALLALNRGRLGTAERTLETGVGEDFRSFLEARLAEGRRRWERLRVWRVTLPHEVWSFYAREARREGLRLDEALTRAICRDHERRGEGG